MWEWKDENRGPSPHSTTTTQKGSGREGPSSLLRFCLSPSPPGYLSRGRLDILLLLRGKELERGFWLDPGGPQCQCHHRPPPNTTNKSPSSSAYAHKQHQTSSQFLAWFEIRQRHTFPKAKKYFFLKKSFLIPRSQER